MIILFLVIRIDLEINKDPEINKFCFFSKAVEIFFMLSLDYSYVET